MKLNWVIAEAGEELQSGEVMSEQAAEETAEEAVTAADGSSGTPEEPAPEQTTTQKLLQWAPFLVIIIVMWLFLFRGPRKKQQQQQNMIKSLKKNDRVRTIGGIIGTVIDVQDDTVTLKIDENNNTKMKIASGAVSKVINEINDQ